MKKVKRYQRTGRKRREKSLLPLFAILLAIPLVLLGLSQQQDIRQLAAEYTPGFVVTTEPVDTLDINISQEDGTAVEQTEDGSGNSGRGNSGGGGRNTTAPPSEDETVCLGCNPPKDEAGNPTGNNQGNNTREVNCEGGNVNLGDIGPNENITVNCNGGTVVDDQSGEDGSGGGGRQGGGGGTGNPGQESINPPIPGVPGVPAVPGVPGSGTKGTPWIGGGGGSKQGGGGGGRQGGIMQSVRERIRQMFDFFGIGRGNKRQTKTPSESKKNVKQQRPGKTTQEP